MWRVNSGMRYLVKGRVKSGREGALAKAIADRTLGRGSIAGDEYLHDMQMARVDARGEAHWVETCFCDPPLEEERPYWEKYFDLLSVKDAHSRRTCRHENGTEPWACCDCRLYETPERETGPNRENLFAGTPVIVAAVAGRGSYPGSSSQYPASIAVRRRIGFEHDYEHEQEYEFGETTHLRIMIRQFVP